MSVDFIDSNVFVYLFDEIHRDKQKAAQSLIDSALRDGSAIISFQVVQETLNVITRKLPVCVNYEHAQQFFTQMLLPLWTINASNSLCMRGLGLQARYQFSFYDSLIVAAALEARCKTLFSEDLQHNQQIDGLTIKNPFQA